jgi:oxygen-independent coproporphyrinogen III oxidase
MTEQPALWSGAAQPAGSAYVHIPFCVRKCSYCDFCSYPGQSAAKQADYTAALLREIAAAGCWARGADGPATRPLDTVFVGGGTPTVLPAEQLSAILAALRRELGLAGDGEFTLEANPGTVDDAGLRACRQAGFNRISLGLQAIQPHLLDILGRIHTRDDFVAGVVLAKDCGFQSINADIMFGLPGQTTRDVADTVDFLLDMPVDHLSFYSLSLEEGTPLKALCDARPELLPDEETEREQYHLIIERLVKAGFVHYEISNAARPGRTCRHNLVYWQGRSYFGFGVAAHSFLQGVRRGNTVGLDDYLQAFRPVEPGAVDPFAAAELLETLDARSAMNEMMMLGLRLLAGVAWRDFADRFGVGLMDVFGPRIAALKKRGLLETDETGVRLSRAGLDLANQVFMEFV